MRALLLLWHDRRGVSALEMALFLPVILAMIIGLMEFGRLILVTQKVQNGAFILADLAARDQTLSEGQLTSIFLAVNNLVEPFDFGAQGTALVSSVVAPATGPAVVRWQRTGAGASGALSVVGAEGTVALMPAGLTLAPGETVIVAEMVFDYQPIFNATPLDQRIRRVAYYKPRLGTLETLLP